MPQPTSLLVFCGCFTAAALVTGCGDSSIRTYTAPKDELPVRVSLASAAGPATMPANPTPSDLAWTVPADWRPGPASDMRYATFLIGPQDKPVELTVIPLGMAGGDMTANVNRWRQQLGLPAAAPAELEKQVVKLPVAGGTAAVVDLLGPEAAGARPRLRMLGAILPQPERVWFFKLVGPDAIVAPQKANFEAFLKSIKLSNAPPTGANAAPDATAIGQPGMPAGHPPVGGAPGAAGTPAMPAGHPPVGGGAPGAGPGAGMGMGPGVGMMPPATAPADAPKWDAPKGWVLDPTPKPLRLATYVVGRADPKADMAVMSLGGEAGGPLANINRWRGQVGLPAVGDLKDANAVSVVAGDAIGLMVDLVGPDSQPPQAQHLLAAMFRVGDQTWFFKLVGPKDVVANEKPAFEALVKSVQWPAK